MKLEDQVVSLELAKKLKTLGVKQESMFDWIEWKEGKSKLIYNDMEHNYDASIKLSFYSAFTVAELGEMLPKHAGSYKKEDEYVAFSDWKEYAWYIDGGNAPKLVIETANTEADARAKMLIYLLENKIITINKDN